MPRPFSGKRKSIPRRGFSRLTSFSVVQLWQRLLTAQMENVDALRRTLFQRHQAEACGISLWYNHSVSYSSNSLKVRREEGGFNVKYLPVITSLFGSSVIDYNPWAVHVLWKYSWTQICVMVKEGKLFTVGNVCCVVTSKDKIHLWGQFKRKKRNSPQLGRRRCEEKHGCLEDREEVVSE